MALRASPRHAASHAGSPRWGSNASITGVSKGRPDSIASLYPSMPVTVLVMDHPCSGVDGSKPGAMRSTSNRPLCTTAMARALARCGSPAPMNACCASFCNALASTPGPHWSGGRAASPCGQGRAARLGAADGGAGGGGARSRSSTQPRSATRLACRVNRPANRAVTLCAATSTLMLIGTSAGLAGSTSSAIRPCHGRPATNAAEQTPLAAMPAALRAIPSATTATSAVATPSASSAVVHRKMR